jgi:Family of unknown function (DUF6325)
MPIDRSELGPVEMMAVAFPGNNFTGEIVPAILELVETGVVRIIDLAFVTKDDDGTTTILEYEDFKNAPEGSETLSVLEELINDEDLEAFADELEPGNSVAILVWEDLWAAKLANAIRNADGQLLALERVPREAIELLLDELSAG